MDLVRITSVHNYFRGGLDSALDALESVQDTAKSFLNALKSVLDAPERVLLSSLCLPLLVWKTSP